MLTKYRNKKKIEKYKQYCSISAICLSTLSVAYCKSNSDSGRNVIAAACLPFLSSLLYFNYLRDKESNKPYKEQDEVIQGIELITATINKLATDGLFMSRDISLTTLQLQCNRYHHAANDLERIGLTNSEQYQKLISELKSALQTLMQANEKFTFDIHLKLEKLEENEYNQDSINELHLMLEKKQGEYQELSAQYAVVNDKFRTHCQDRPRLTNYKFG